MEHPCSRRFAHTFVRGFPRHLLIYSYDRESAALRIVHVLHGARNLEAILTGSPYEDE